MISVCDKNLAFDNVVCERYLRNFNRFSNHEVLILQIETKA